MYKIPFVSLGGSSYEVRIGTGSATTLTGAAHPFVTQEDDDDDMFKPVRLQSGYFRIIDQTGIWRNLMPSSAVSTPVALYRGNTVLWRGFMKPETYSGDYLLLPQERSFPIVCQLSVLEGYDVSPSAGDMVNIAFVLWYIFSKAGTWNYVFFQGKDAVDWLNKEVSWLNFVEYDEDGTARSKYNCLELLEEVCKFFGWTCRTYADNIYFTAADDVISDAGWTRMEYYDLYEIAGGHSIQPTYLNWNNENVSFFANTDNEEQYLQGIRKVTVTADINKKEKLIEIPFDKIEKLFRGKSVSQTSQGDTYSFIVNYYPTAFEDDNVDIDCYYDQGFTSGRFVANEVYEGSLADKHNYNFTYSLGVYGKDFSFNECVVLRSKYPYAFFNGAITINGSVKPFESSVPDGYLQLALKVGDYYWNGSTWTTTQSRFEVRIKDGKIADTRVLNSDYDSYTGAGIPLTARSGIVTLYILGAYGDTTVEGFGASITSLNIGFVRRASVAQNSDRSSNVYINTGNTVFANDYSVNTILASDNGNSVGLGLLINGNSGYVTTLPYTGASGGGSDERPELHLVNRIALWGSYTHRKLMLNMKESELLDISPLFMLSDAYSQDNLYPISINHDWRDNIITLTLLQLWQ